MNPTSSRRLVLASLLGLLALATYRGNLAGDQGIAKRLWGVGMLGLMLSALADFVPQVAGPLAFLVLAGYATSGGDAAVTNILGKVSGSAAPAGARPGAAVHPANTPPARRAPAPVRPGTNP